MFKFKLYVVLILRLKAKFYFEYYDWNMILKFELNKLNKVPIYVSIL